MILAILQARMSSTRLPGKVLKPILNEPMLMRQVERVLRSKVIDKLCVATTVDISDDPIAEMCKAKGINCFRGSLTDVLDRFYQVATEYKAEHIVRLTGDCPLADPKLIDNVIRFYTEGQYDFVSNCIEPKFPDGLDVAVFNMRVLAESWEKAELQSHREHVTLFARESSEYVIGSYENERDLSFMRWTVDEMEDFDFIEQVYEELYPRDSEFLSEDVYNLLKRKPELLKINAHYSRNEGLKRSLQEDRRNQNES